MRAMQSEPQRKALDQLLVLGTLLEGHADHVMDAVGPRWCRRWPPSAAGSTNVGNASNRRCSACCVRCWVSTPSSASTPAARRSSTTWWTGSGWSGSTPSGQPRNPAAASGNRRPAAMDRPGAVAQLVQAVDDFRRRPSADGEEPMVCRAVRRPGLAGADRGRRGARPTTALIVDHGLQPDSAARRRNRPHPGAGLGCVDAQVLCVRVGIVGGPEAAARTARYAALDAARDGAPVLLAHTLDDQAETVLLGLGRGSGPRSIAGMRPHDPPWCRPLLGVRRRHTAGRVRGAGSDRVAGPAQRRPAFHPGPAAIEVLPLLEEVLGGGVAEALARTAAALREDTEFLDALAAQALPERCGTGLDVDGAGDAAGRRPAPGDPRLAARRRRHRAVRQADPRGRPPDHRLARAGRGRGRFGVARRAPDRRATRRRADPAARTCVNISPRRWLFAR